MIFMAKKFHKKQELKKHALYRELGISPDKELPKKFLDKIHNSKIGIRLQNPTKIGRSEVLVTKKLKKRVAMTYQLNQTQICAEHVGYLGLKYSLTHRLH